MPSANFLRNPRVALPASLLGLAMTFAVAAAISMRLSASAGGGTPHDPNLPPPSEAQEGKLIDGFVTLEELTVASEAYANCINDIGYGTQVIPGDRKRPPQVNLRSPLPGGPVDVRNLHEQVSACQSEHVAALLQAWDEQYGAGNATTADIEEVYAFMNSCVDAGGVDAHRAFTGEWFPVVSAGYRDEPISITADEYSAFQSCGLELWAETGFVPPSMTLSATG